MSAKICIIIPMVAALLTAASAHNITAILEGFPDYSLFNSYLTQTKVSDEINSHETVTVLALPNGAMSALAAKKPLSGIKNALRILVLLDYYDPTKLHDLPRGTTLSTTLYQTTGNAPGNSGFVNITNVRGGKVAFGPSAPGSKLMADYSKSVKQLPYNISVLEISAPIVFPGLMDAPSAATANITSLLEKAGCKTFAGLVQSSGVLKMFEAAEDKGLTLFAPNDEAFKAKGAPDLSSLSSAELVTLLQYHALPSYSPKASLKNSDRPISTMATSGAGKFDLSVEWPMIYISLSRKEKEDDFLAMKGAKLPLRPKKRAKNIEKAIQSCLPGMWLSDLTRGRYEVREKKRVKKKRRGLKGMERMDSDSE